jgi:hypothetical protein
MLHLRTRRTTAALAATVGSLLLASAAQAATLTVDDDRTDCPTAQFTSIQAAVDAAATGDIVAVCPGNYDEGTGQPGTNALTIAKSLTLKGAGAGLVHIAPKATGPAGGAILEASPSIRNGVGDIVAINGTPARPLTVNISGVTVDGHDADGRAIAVEAGIVFLDAKGSVVRSHVTNVVTSEGDNAYTVAGGWRGSQPGIGIAQTSNALAAPVDGARGLVIDRTRIDKYNQIGILVDGASNDAAPFLPSGTVNSATITGSQVIGRTECVNYAGTGNCSTVGLLTSGPLFGQDGIRATNNARIKVSDSLISQNLVNGTNAPVRTTATGGGATNPPVTITVTTNSANNANLGLGAGIRLLGAGLTTVAQGTGQVLYSQASTSNITDNSYGVLNLAADGTTAATGDPNATGNNSLGNLFKAENNYWGVNYYRPWTGGGSVNPGPAISPTDNPAVPENPVNGTATVETATAGTTSDAVDFYPFRSGVQSDMSAGEWPVLSAPVPVADAAPAVALGGDTTVARGGTLTLSATAADDFGVKSVTFYDGTAKLGTASVGAYAATEAIAADAACGSRAISAIAEDSLGQTTIARGTLTVTGCDAAPAPPAQGGGGSAPAPVPASAAPTIGIKPVTSAVKASGTTVELTPAAAAGVKQVDVFLGTRKLCTLTAAPWTCRVVPTGADVGTQVLRTVVTDAAGQTSESSQTLRIAKFAPRGLSVKVAGRDVKGGAVRKTVTGRVLLPAGVTAAQGCKGGSATIVVKRAGHSVSNSEVKVTSACTFTKHVTAKRVKAGSGAFSYSVRFTGTAVLSSASSTRRSS